MRERIGEVQRVRHRPRPGAADDFGGVLAGCGCLSLLALGAWLAFVVYVGLEGRGNDEEVSAYLAAATCCVRLHVIAITAVGLVLALRKGQGAPS